MEGYTNAFLNAYTNTFLHIIMDVCRPPPAPTVTIPARSLINIKRPSRLESQTFITGTCAPTTRSPTLYWLSYGTGPLAKTQKQKTKTTTKQVFCNTLVSYWANFIFSSYEFYKIKSLLRFLRCCGLSGFICSQISAFRNNLPQHHIARQHSLARGVCEQVTEVTWLWTASSWRNRTVARKLFWNFRDELKFVIYEVENGRRTQGDI